MAKATAVPPQNMTPHAWAAISQKYASVVQPMQVYLLHRKPILSKGLPTASSIYRYDMLIFARQKFCILSTGSTVCSTHSIKAMCLWLFWRKDGKPESAPWQWPHQEYTRWKRKIHTRLALLRRPEFAVGEAYGESTWFNPKKSNW